tara:strand:+ start:51 stop:257 length:207 start_codon:yes stop_codon:yes gene_type:complete
MAVINRAHEWDVEDINYNINQIEDSKTLKAVMFLMIQEHVRSIPNDQELGARIRKIVLNFNKENNENN